MDMGCCNSEFHALCDRQTTELSDDRITRETLSYNNPCPSSPSSTILRSAYMALNTLQQDWLLYIDTGANIHNEGPPNSIIPEAS